MPLFYVFAEASLVVDAATEKEAALVAKNSLSELGSELDIVVREEIKCLKDLPYGWDGKCCPYGGSDDRLLSERLPEVDDTDYSALLAPVSMVIPVDKKRCKECGDEIPEGEGMAETGTGSKSAVNALVMQFVCFNKECPSSDMSESGCRKHSVYGVDLCKSFCSRTEKELIIDSVIGFAKAYEKEKYRVMDSGGTLLSVSGFMLDYCQKIRNSA